MDIRYPAIGICGLSCMLCPSRHTEAESRCGGCKSPGRMAVGCPFITCAVKKKGIEFCWDCDEGKKCVRWRKHREFSRKGDTFVCYQTLEDNIALAEKKGVAALARHLARKEALLKQMLAGFNEGRSKTYLSIAANVMEASELEAALGEARRRAKALSLGERSKVIHEVLDGIAARKGYVLKLRKWK